MEDAAERYTFPRRVRHQYSFVPPQANQVLIILLELRLDDDEFHFIEHFLVRLRMLYPSSWGWDLCLIRSRYMGLALSQVVWGILTQRW